ncbi:MAG: aminoglycoside phosphotransferase family protein [Rickettsiales bacterium]|jgi:aminoglycoside phosphotransferase (APT) family kinase protein|nr:aminoglycoside phosphotransferase family protein [Rickettsiales bacterium]
MPGKRTFFTADEDIGGIIRRAAPDIGITSIQIVPTGWTNIVAEAETAGGGYFFRFPRDEFWAKMLAKDYEFSKFVRGRTSFPTNLLSLLRDDGRIFSMHKKIPGQSLSRVAESLSAGEARAVADDISRFIIEMGAIPAAAAPAPRMDLAEFLRLLGERHFEDKSEEYFRTFRNYKGDIRIVHGDLNPGNIIVRNGRVFGVIDFCFAGPGPYAYSDLPWLCNRLPPSFGKIMLESFESVSGTRVDPGIFSDFLKAWKFIGTEYVRFMRNNHPEIKVPAGAL